MPCSAGARAPPGPERHRESVVARAARGHELLDQQALVQPAVGADLVAGLDHRRSRGRGRGGVTWEELGAATRPEDLRFSPADVLDRVAEHGDLAADLLLDDRPPLPAG